MTSILHVTNGDSAVRPIEEAGIGGEVIAWRDVLRDGPKAEWRWDRGRRSLVHAA